jgi:hypothetical protein
MMWVESVLGVEASRPTFTVADVFRQHWNAYQARYPVTREQKRAAHAIMDCRTAVLGGHVDVCDACGWIRISYNSCGNRNCPTCGAFDRAQWLAAREIVLLPIQYFHIVFTCDHALNPLVRANAVLIYNLLFDAAGPLLKQYGQKYLGGEIGATGGLHTWGEDLNEHLHSHWIVTGGAWQTDTEGKRHWKSAAADFLFPVLKLSREYRDRVCDGLLKLWHDGKLKLVGACADLDVEALVAQMRAKNWEVYIKPAHGEGVTVFEYLSRYINRVAISNYRLVSIENGQVSFRYCDNRDGGKEKVMTLDALEFLRRFLLHVLPSRFVRIRHYGLHHSSKREALKQCRATLGLPYALPVLKPLLVVAWLTKILGHHPNLCPRCGQGMLEPRGEFGSLSPVWVWLLTLLGFMARRRATG